MNKLTSIILVCIILSSLAISYSSSSENYVLVPSTFESGSFNATSNSFEMDLAMMEFILTENTSSSNYQTFTGFEALIENESVYNPSQDLFAISAWIKKEMSTGPMPIACRWNDSVGVTERSFCLTVDSDDKLLLYTSPDGVTHYNLKSSTTLDNNKWYFVAGSYNNSDLRLFINGKEDNHKNVALGMHPTDSPITIGGSNLFGEMRYFNGTIDEVAYYNISFSEVEVFNQFNREKTRFEVLLSTSSDFSKGNIRVSSSGLNNFTQPEYYDDSYSVLVEHFESGDSLESVGANVVNSSFVSGMFGQGIYLNGKAYAEIPDSDKYDITGDDFTLEFWMKTNQSANDNSIISKGSINANTNTWYVSLDSSNNFNVNVGDTLDNIKLSIPSGEITDDNWHHITMSWDNTLKKLILFVDGAERDSGTNSNVDDLTNSHNLVIGNDKDLDNSFSGIIDELRITKGVAKKSYDSLNDSELNISDLQRELPDGTYYWKVRTTDADNSGREVSPSMFSKWSLPYVLKVDTTAPVIILENITDEDEVTLNESQPLVTDQNITIRANVTDVPSGVSSVWLKVWSGVAELSSIIWEGFMSLIGDIFEATFGINTTDWQAGEVNYTIYANDTLDQETSLQGSFYVQYNITTDVNGKKNLEYFNYTDLYINYTLNNGTAVYNAICNVTLNGVEYNLSMNPITLRYEYRINSTNFSLAEYPIVYACSKLWTEPASNSSHLNIRDTIAPSLENPNISTNSVLEYGIDNIVFNASMFDYHSLNPVVEIELPNKSRNNYTMNGSGLSGEFSFEYNSSLYNDLVGNFSYSIIVTDDSGNLNRSYGGNFTINDTIAPDLVMINPGNNSWMRVNNIMFNYSAYDINSLKACQLLINNVNNTNISIPNDDAGALRSFRVDGVPDGLDMEWNVTCWDKNGNSNSTDGYILTVDTIFPNLNVTLPSDNYMANETPIMFGFNVSDGTALSNCTLEFNNTKNTTYKLTNDYNILQYISLDVDDEGNDIEWNISCYDNVSNVNTSTSRWLDLDTIAPRVYMNNINGTIYQNTSTGVINVTINDLNLDSVKVYVNNIATHLNGTTNSTSGNVTHNITGNQHVFTIVNLTDGTWDISVFANDTFLRDNQSSNITFIVDTIYPTQPVLIYPGADEHTTDYTPAFNWNPSIDANLDNYTIEISENAEFSSLTKNYTTTDSNYQVPDSDSISAQGTYFWRVIAVDKTNNQNYSNYSRFYIDNVEVVTLAPIVGATAGGGGGGGGGSRGSTSITEIPGEFRILEPLDLTMYQDDSIYSPIVLYNPTDRTIKEITLKATTTEDKVKVKLDKPTLPYLLPQQREVIGMNIETSPDIEGAYEVTVRATSVKSKFEDVANFYLNIVGFGKSNRTFVEEKLLFSESLLNSNPECLDLKEVLDEARTAFDNNEFAKVEDLSENLINSCNALVKISRGEGLPEGEEIAYSKPIKAMKTLGILIAEILGFLLLVWLILKMFIFKPHPKKSKRKK